MLGRLHHPSLATVSRRPRFPLVAPTPPRCGFSLIHTGREMSFPILAGGRNRFTSPALGAASCLIQLRERRPAPGIYPRFSPYNSPFVGPGAIRHRMAMPPRDAFLSPLSLQPSGRR